MVEGEEWCRIGQLDLSDGDGGVDDTDLSYFIFVEFSLGEQEDVLYPVILSELEISRVEGWSFFVRTKIANCLSVVIYSLIVNLRRGILPPFSFFLNIDEIYGFRGNFNRVNS